MKGIGPFLNRDFGYQDRPRALFSKLPIGVDGLLDYKVFFEDFYDWVGGGLTGAEDNVLVDIAAAAAATAGGAAPTAAQVDTGIATAVAPIVSGTNLALKELQSKANRFQVVKDTGASVALSADAENGALVLTSAATTDNDGASIQAINTPFLCKSGKSLWFEARVKVSDADQCDMFVGLADNFATDPEAVVAEGVARVGFELIDGSAVVRTVVDNDTAATKTSSGISMADDTYIRLGFRTDGGHVRFYVNRSLVGAVAIPSAIAAVTLGPTFFNLSGDALGTHTASIDYIFAAQARV